MNPDSTATQVVGPADEPRVRRGLGGRRGTHAFQPKDGSDATGQKSGAQDPTTATRRLTLTPAKTLVGKPSAAEQQIKAGQGIGDHGHHHGQLSDELVSYRQ